MHLGDQFVTHFPNCNRFLVVAINRGGPRLDYIIFLDGQTLLFGTI